MEYTVRMVETPEGEVPLALLRAIMMGSNIDLSVINWRAHVVDGEPVVDLTLRAKTRHEVADGEESGV